MSVWFFRVVLERACFTYTPMSGVEAPLNGTFACRVLFDGEEVNLDLTPTPQHVTAKRSVAFKYRIRASTWEDLALALNQRSACLQILCFNEAEKQDAPDAHSSAGLVVGIASIDLLSLAQNVTAQYELPLMPPNAGSSPTKLGRLSVCITMEQMCDFRLQLKEVRASGIEAGAYKLRYFLSSSSVYMCSNPLRSKLGSVMWTGGTLQELLFHGTLRTLASLEFAISLLKSGKNGREPPVAIFTVSLLQLQTNSTEKIREIPFLLEEPESPRILSGVLQVRGLPVAQQNIRRVTIPCRSYARDEVGDNDRRFSVGVALGRSHNVATLNSSLQRLPASGEAITGSIDVPSAPPHALLGAGPAAVTAAALSQALEQDSASSRVEEGGSDNASTTLAYGGNLASCDGVCCLKPPLCEDVGNYTLPLSGAALASECSLLQEQEGRDGSDVSFSSPLPPDTAADIGDVSKLSLHVSSIKEDTPPSEEEEEEGHHLAAPYGDTLQEGKQQQQDEAEKDEEAERKHLMYREYHLLQELDRVKESIDILQGCLQNTRILSSSTDYDAATQIDALEQELSELGRAETTLMQLEDRLQERFRHCSEQYRISEAEFHASMQHLAVYADVLINIDRSISAEMQEVELDEPAAKGTVASFHLPHPPHAPKPTWKVKKKKNMRGEGGGE
ncbi:hypothetical protein TraAM80_06535 [Trypanosoma rangeli]|uniref:Uncharacterized protein n=1 Tax=Trypanosoma rangeli TaxID=5698 RepID=A0A3R7RGC1_TRYRA|nr:uncharacterized protein TraAM80_06535 [Trypanosoma rangeli]RNF02207.1 hypothetical protein TraAM80_06535 [Trypanosoma rangeli]|eukprot:RNF02207.1 hypothetical protein TraAM80_06535 [Trypanosoma rangeli]